MNRRAAGLGATAFFVAGAARAAAQVVQNAIHYEVKTPEEAEAALESLVSGPGITVQINGFSLSPNLAGDGYILLVLVTAPV